MTTRDQPKQNRLKIGFPVSAFLLGSALGLIVYAGIAGRWESFAVMYLYPAAFLGWLIWNIHLACLLTRQVPPATMRFVRWVGFPFVALVTFIVIMIPLASWVGGAYRNHEVRAAVDAGLYTDCMQLLKNWPMKANRIFSEDPEYAKLPLSIRMLSPEYVTRYGTSDPYWPPSIGICKNGFGGFAMGVRVFNNDQDAKKLQDRGVGCQRIATGVYLWWENT